MSRHRTGARLARLERRAGTADRTYGFTIDPAVAKALWDDEARLLELIRKPYVTSANGGPLTPTEIEEEARLSESIAATRRSLTCPEGYGEVQARIDEERRRLLCMQRPSPAYGGVPLTAAEDAEEMELVARLAAYENSAEYRARRRILDLRWKREDRTPAEESEFEELRKRYPDLPPGREDRLRAWAGEVADNYKRLADSQASREAASSRRRVVAPAASD